MRNNCGNNISHLIYKMCSLPFEPMHLDEEDLVYELRLRNIIVDNINNRNLTKLLRECLFKELKGLQNAPMM